MSHIEEGFKNALRRQARRYVLLFPICSMPELMIAASFQATVFNEMLATLPVWKFSELPDRLMMSKMRRQVSSFLSPKDQRRIPMVAAAGNTIGQKMTRSIKTSCHADP